MNLPHHPAVEPAVRLVYSGCINEDDLPRRASLLGFYIEHSLNAVAGGLRFVSHNRDFFAHQRIQQRAFTCIRAADDGDKTGTEGHDYASISLAGAPGLERLTLNFSILRRVECRTSNRKQSS